MMAFLGSTLLTNCLLLGLILGLASMENQWKQ